jgi:hypothetical protein
VASSDTTNPETQTEEVLTTFSLPGPLNQRINRLSVMLEAEEDYWDWGKNRLLIEAIKSELARLQQDYGDIPASGRQLRRGRRPGGPARRAGLEKVSARLPKDLDSRLKDAVLFLRRQGQTKTKNDLVEEALEKLVRSLSEQLGITLPEPSP